jgi:hypothetical protein
VNAKHYCSAQLPLPLIEGGAKLLTAKGGGRSIEACNATAKGGREAWWYLAGTAEASQISRLD